MDMSLPPSEPRLPVPGRLRTAGFSLIEVCLSLAIVAFTFIAVIGLLPAGMQVYDVATTTTAQTRIVSHLTGMVETGGYDKVLAQNRIATFYYYDMDGSYLDSDTNAVPAYEVKRIYAARILSGKLFLPNSTDAFNVDKTASRTIVVMGRYEPRSLDAMRGLIDAASVAALPPGSRLKTQALLLTRMGSEMDPP